MIVQVKLKAKLLYKIFSSEKKILGLLVKFKEFEAFLFTLYRGKGIPERLQPSLKNN
jgi:hypothetical protein